MNIRDRAWFVAVASLALTIAGCNTPKLTRTGPQVPSKPKNCSFELLTTMPEGRFAEVGVIDLKNLWNPTTDISRFKENITPKVCEAGGDVAIAYANGSGVWIKATVLKKLRNKQQAPEVTKKKEDTGGCRFDTQCKGDRVCVEGKCVAPPGAAAAPTATAPAAPMPDSGQ